MIRRSYELRLLLEDWPDGKQTDVALRFVETATEPGQYARGGKYPAGTEFGMDTVGLDSAFTDYERLDLVQQVLGDPENTIQRFITSINEDKRKLDGFRSGRLGAVDAGGGYPLDGLLALPEDGAKAAIVLVHGSGPSDKDETIGANKPFRDIAHALAEKGVAVLRYDKRTLTYGDRIAGDEDVLAKLTIYDETIYDAVAAVKLLKKRFEKVYVLGHSMSGGLLAEIDANGADCDGYIVLEGTPRKLYELSADQNLLYANELEENGDADDAEQIRGFVRSELEKGAKLPGLPDADALSAENAVFGMSAWYLRSFDGIDTLGAHLKDGKPILVVQGGRDRQVTEKDFGLWKSGLAAHPNATFKLYPALNHLLGEYEGEDVPFSELTTREYAQSTPVSVEVTNDIYDWISTAGQEILT